MLQIFLSYFTAMSLQKKKLSRHGLYVTMREGLETWQMVVLAPGQAMTSLMEELPLNPWGSLKNTDSQAKSLHVLKDPPWPHLPPTGLAHFPTSPRLTNHSTRHLAPSFQGRHREQKLQSLFFLKRHHYFFHQLC